MGIRIISVVGTRPNFVKIAPLIREFKKHREIESILVHTGQHYDKEMSRLFFEQLEIPKPDINLNVGSSTDVQQTAKIMVEFEKILLEKNPGLVVVVGDVNSTLAAALTAKKCGIRVAHVEAGLRSFDMGMPEEANRILTDHISDYLFTTEESGNRNLKDENISKNKIYFVGNVMIDSLLSHKERARESKILANLKLNKNEYCAATFHRPSNVDNKNSLKKLLNLVQETAKKIKVVLPLHPRTLNSIEKFGLADEFKKIRGLIMTNPLGYLDFICLMMNSKFVITDSGGIQEETTVLQVPCITFRENTERPVTAKEGTNLAVTTDIKKIQSTIEKIMSSKASKGKIPKFWDGKAAERITDIILKSNEKKK